MKEMKEHILSHEELSMPLVAGRMYHNSTKRNPKKAQQHNVQIS
jgi:hypothetical protein